MIYLTAGLLLVAQLLLTWKLAVIILQPRQESIPYVMIRSCS